MGPRVELDSEPDDDVIDISPQPKSTTPGGPPLANMLNLHVLNTWHPGQAIHDTLIDHVIEVLQSTTTSAQEWYIIPSAVMTFFAGTMSRDILPYRYNTQTRAVTVLRLPHRFHFVCVSYKDGSIQVRDSLYPEQVPQGWPDETTSDLLTKFWLAIDVNNTPENRPKILHTMRQTGRQ